METQPWRGETQVIEEIKKGRAQKVGGDISRETEPKEVEEPQEKTWTPKNRGGKDLRNLERIVRGKCWCHREIGDSNYKRPRNPGDGKIAEKGGAPRMLGGDHRRDGTAEKWVGPQ